jgi:hypothetical protein
VAEQIKIDLANVDGVHRRNDDHGWNKAGPGKLVKEFGYTERFVVLRDVHGRPLGKDPVRSREIPKDIRVNVRSRQEYLAELDATSSGRVPRETVHRTE